MPHFITVHHIISNVILLIITGNVVLRDKKLIIFAITGNGV